MNDPLLTDTLWGLVPALVLVNPLAVVALFSQRTKIKIIFHAVTLLAAVIAAALLSGGEHEGGTHAPLLLGLGVFLYSPGALALTIDVFRSKTPWTVRSMGLLPIAAVAGFGIGAVAWFAKSVDALPETWAAAPANLRQMIPDAVKELAEDNFNLVAVNGRFVTQTKTPHPVHDLAVYLFSRSLALSLQKGMNVGGAQVAEFVPFRDTLQIVPTPDSEGRYLFRLAVASRFTFRLHWDAPSEEAAALVPDKVWEDAMPFSMEGFYNPLTGSILLTYAFPVDISDK